jgi:hypothetical protein
MPSQIQYLNTDLDLVSERDFADLAAALAKAGVRPLSVVRGDDESRHATFETNETYPDPETNIRAMLSVVERLSSELRSAWDACTRREFNVGYDCGEEPWGFNQGLSTELLGRMAAAGTTFRVTIYPERP